MNTALYVLVVNLCNQLLFPLIFPGPHNTTIFQQKLTKLWDLFVGSFLLISQLKPKKLLYVSIVRSRITYCSQIWKPNHIKDITALERIQSRATKYILNDYCSDYKDRLIKLELLPLMQFYEYLDLVFIVKCLKSTDTTSNFQVSNFLNFSKSPTRSSTFTKFILNKSRTDFSRHFYFNRVAHLWNLLPQLDLNLTIPTIKETLWTDFLANFKIHVHFTCSAPVTLADHGILQYLISVIKYTRCLSMLAACLQSVTHLICTICNN